MPFLRKLYYRIGMLPILFVIAVTAFGLEQPRFLSMQNLSNVAIQSSYMTIVALAQTLVIIAGGFDISVGATIALSSIFAAMCLTVPGLDPSVGILFAALATLATGTAVGAVNGAFVAVTRVSPLIVTLGSMTAVQGIALIVSNGIPIFGLPKEFGGFFSLGRVLGVPVPAIGAILALIVTHVLLQHTRLGRYIYAVGANPRAAHVSGVPVLGTTWLTYALTGLLTGLAAFLLVARVGSGEPNLGATFPLTSIAAAVLGGVSLRGGEGGAIGAALGAVFITLITNGMDLTGVGSFVQMLVLGVVLILAAVLDAFRHKIRI
jgi:ribose transport system permease protein